MTRQMSHVATPEDAGKRLDAVIGALPGIASRSQGAKACEEGRVQVNGQLATKKQVLSSGDVIIVEVPDAPSGLVPEPLDLDIRYEDDEVIVLAKPAGMICHPSPDHAFGTLAAALLYRYGWDGLCDVQGDADRPGIVHRLDGDTSGLMLAAKTDDAGSALMDAIATRSVDRRYLALVHGIVSVDSGMVDAPICRSRSDRQKMAVGDDDSARDAITTFKVVERFDAGHKDQGYTLLECKLYTGRTHQIRVHMQYIKHPVVGDMTYTAFAPKDAVASLGLERQFLHSYRLGFTHPCTQAQMSFSDVLPDDLARALASLEGRSANVTDYGRDVLALLRGEMR